METEMDLLLLSLFRPKTSRQPGNPDQDSHQSFPTCFLLWIPKSDGFCLKFERSSGEFQSGPLLTIGDVDTSQ